MEQGSTLKGASAVIEKDLASGLLAQEVDADVLMILTDVDEVALNYGNSDERGLMEITADEKMDKDGSALPGSDSSVRDNCLSGSRNPVGCSGIAGSVRQQGRNMDDGKQRSVDYRFGRSLGSSLFSSF